MKITNKLTDDGVLMEMGGRLAKMRLERNLTQAQLAQQSGVSKRTVERLEKGAVATQLAGFIRMCRTLGVLDRLDNFLPEPVPSPVEQLKRRGKQRQRASSSRKAGKASVKKWHWGDEK
jgi:transcriptional regulator with XRE-family HTH domain